MQKILNAIFGDPNKKVVDALRRDVEKINAFESKIQALSDEDLKAKTVEFRARLNDGEALDDLVYEAFAVVREAARRQLGQRHFDVQLMGGLVLHRRGIAEMRTGEGKTLTATAPLYANALMNKGCHLVTVNDYLAKRDAVWMGQVFHALGLSVGCISHEGGFLYDPKFKHEPVTPLLSPLGKGGNRGVLEEHDKERDETGAFRIHKDFLRPVSRKEAYSADITYGTNNEFGFDYLRDNMVATVDQCVIRGLHYAIVDEVDSILIDEARTPLIISAPAEESSTIYQKFAAIARTLKENMDYNVDEKMRTATYTEQGIEKVEKALGVDNMYASGSNLQYYADTALRAHALFKRDVQYVVKDGQIVIVDEFTGRMMPGRRYSEGIHQAIEAKEGVEIQNESQTLATITFQNFFRMYDKLAGMTGTAATEAEEFAKIYTLDVTSVPTHRDNQRKDLPDRVYKNELGKFQAVIQDVKERHEKGQPILIGTVSIEKNELLGTLLEREGIPFNMLNAKNHEKEAEYIAQAGRKGAVTLATNMAGRGVDIMLGGNPPDAKTSEEVKAAGGLHVIGTERHESRRIDNQLRGRSGRQGDPGSTQFYVSMEDDLMRIFGSDRVKGIMDRLGIPDDMPIENKMVTNSIEKAQQRVEGHNFDIRKHLLEYDDVLNKHREVVYRRRREILEASAGELTAIKDKILELIEEEVEQVVLFHTGEDVPLLTKEGQGEVAGGTKTDWNPKEIIEVVSTIVQLTDVEKVALAGELSFQDTKDRAHLAGQRSRLIDDIMRAVKRTYEEIEKQFEDRAQLHRVEKGVILQAIDILWIDHLAAMGALRTGIGLQGYAQRDPLVEYKKESYGMFQRLLASVNQEIVYSFFKAAKHAINSRAAMQLSRSLLERAGIQLMGAAKESGNNARPPSQVTASGGIPSNGGREQQGVVGSTKKVGRNDPCPCGSGKKYKKCHGA